MQGQSKKNLRIDYLVQWSNESEADATWEEGVNLWQFEKELVELRASMPKMVCRMRQLGRQVGLTDWSAGWSVHVAEIGRVVAEVLRTRLDAACTGSMQRATGGVLRVQDLCATAWGEREM
ncbi:hypothetical protein Salat_1479400 [Sesamum alatum]|uniref:Chromo domain-containing protein n=1 Tax=Sesamum alatum TaxID=300844 RepID=A0AAE1YBD4_9LAMI|nr:hypothetical protein Salat_1479400 [Sesamum alatum]